MRGKKRDPWEIFEIVVKSLGVALVPVVIAYLGHIISNQQKTMEQISRFANQVASDKARERLVAVIMLGHYAKKGDLDPALQFALAKIAETDPDAEVAKAAASVLSEKDKQEISKARPRVYIHIAADSRRAQASELRDKLVNDGHYAVGQIQLVKAGPTSTQVRYFRSEDLNGAEKLAKEVGGKVEIKDLSKYYSEDRIPKGYLEVWYGK